MAKPFTPHQIQIGILDAFRHTIPTIRPGEIVPIMAIQLLLHEAGVRNDEFNVELQYLIEAGEVDYKSGARFAKLTPKGFRRMLANDNDGSPAGDNVQ